MLTRNRKTLLLVFIVIFILACGGAGQAVAPPPISTSTLMSSPTAVLTAIPILARETPVPETNKDNNEIIIAVIGLIGVIAGGAITGFATIKAAKIQAQKK